MNNLFVEQLMLGFGEVQIVHNLSFFHTSEQENEMKF